MDDLDFSPEEIATLDGLDEDPNYTDEPKDEGLDLGDAPTFADDYSEDPDPPGDTEIIAGDGLTDDELMALAGIGDDEEEQKDEGLDLGDAPTFADDYSEDPDPVGDTEIIGDDLTEDELHTLSGINEHDEQEYVEERVIKAEPVLVEEKHNALEVREWEISFGPVSAPAGEQTTVTISPQCLFRGEKIMASDTGSTPGRGTRIISVVVGNKQQKPTNNGRGTLTSFFNETALANGITFDTAKPWSKIAVTISFVEACTFDMSVFGRAVVD